MGKSFGSLSALSWMTMLLLDVFNDIFRESAELRDLLDAILPDGRALDAFKLVWLKRTMKLPSKILNLSSVPSLYTTERISSK